MEPMEGMKRQISMLDNDIFPMHGYKQPDQHFISAINQISFNELADSLKAPINRQVNPEEKSNKTLEKQIKKTQRRPRNYHFNQSNEQVTGVVPPYTL